MIGYYLFIYLFIYYFHNKDYTSITLYKDVARGPQKTTRLVRGGPLVTIILSNRTITNTYIYMSILLDCKSVPLLQCFLWFKSAIWWTSINPNLVYALANRRFFPRFSSTRRKMLAFKPFFLHVKVTRSTNLWSVCRRKLELTTYLNTESYNHISFLNTRWQLV